MTDDPKARQALQLGSSNKRAFLLRLVLSEVIAKRGEGPLALRFGGIGARGLTPRPQEAQEKLP